MTVRINPDAGDEIVRTPADARDDYVAEIDKTNVPSPYTHEWDLTPHVILDIVPVKEVRLWDCLLGGTVQVEGIGVAEHRGQPALRFDLAGLVSGKGTGRLILDEDMQIADVKRYLV